jgi:3-isopropylmalate dehydratase small subunit
MVAARFGDDLTTDDVVTWGPRVENLDPGDLVGLIFSGCDSGLRSRLAAGPSGLVAGRNALAGPRGEVSAWVLSRAGVRVVLALSFAPNAMRDLAATGVLALEWPQPKHGAMEPGDEIEVAGGIESLAEGVPVTVRNLARGTQELLRHRLDARWLDILRAGGLVRHGLGNVQRLVGSRDSGMIHRVAGGA